tara:strand:- start:284 stop:484 length:201 start_codon:yes stop_codon:yes gene_type:complete
MHWLDILGWFLAFSIATSLFYKKGVKDGIKHALKTLNLEQYQIEKLNKELKKDSHDLAMKTMKSRS